MPIADLLAQITGETKPSLPTLTLAKRKPDDYLSRSNEKLLKREQPAGTSSAGTPLAKKSTNAFSQITKSRDSVITPPKSASSIPGSSQIPSQPTISATEPPKQPKKGSFAEILARGKAAQATLTKVGTIQHKAVSKGLNKRQRQELKEHEALERKGSKKAGRSGMLAKSQDGRQARDARDLDRVKSGRVSKNGSAPPEKKIKKAALATTGYTGTARPTPAARSASLKLAGSGSRPSIKAPDPRRPSYVSEDEEEEDDEDDEDEEEYYSDASSDMEAAAFEVDEEEARAARIARKEDELAAQEEARHKREKEEKRRRLMAMAKKRR